ncbi:MAG TPA: DoxX family protein [Candidatus Acidoferrales bacterium]|jgi:putative oxidoreductase|nr:DoxX family protein [Candidatus Acidoferrales bacterium]
MDIALLIVRLAIGLGMAAHGAQKLFGWFGGYGLAGTGGFFEGLGFKPGKLFAAAAGFGEVGSGLLIALGIGGALGPALLIMVMLVAIATVHIGKGFFAQNGGWELNAAYISAALVLAFTGFGAYSLDRVLGLNVLTDPRQAWIALGAAVVLALLNVLARRPTASQQATQ